MNEALDGNNQGVAHLVVPGAGTAGVGALVPGVDVDQHTVAVPSKVSRALAVASPAVAGESDVLTGEAAAGEGGHVAVERRRRGKSGDCESSNCGEAGELEHPVGE